MVVACSFQFTQNDSGLGNNPCWGKSCQGEHLFWGVKLCWGSIATVPSVSSRILQAKQTKLKRNHFLPSCGSASRGWSVGSGLGSIRHFCGYTWVFSILKKYFKWAIKTHMSQFPFDLSTTPDPSIGIHSQRTLFFLWSKSWTLASSVPWSIFTKKGKHNKLILCWSGQVPVGSQNPQRFCGAQKLHWMISFCHTNRDHTSCPPLQSCDWPISSNEPPPSLRSPQQCLLLTTCDNTEHCFQPYVTLFGHNYLFKHALTPSYKRLSQLGGEHSSSREVRTHLWTITDPDHSRGERAKLQERASVWVFHTEVSVFHDIESDTENVFLTKFQLSLKILNSRFVTNIIVFFSCMPFSDASQKLPQKVVIIFKKTSACKKFCFSLNHINNCLAAKIGPTVTASQSMCNKFKFLQLIHLVGVFIPLLLIKHAMQFKVDELNWVLILFVLHLRKETN